MKKLITAFAAASILLAGPALADRAGHQRNQASGSAFDKAYSKHQRETRREKWHGDKKRKEFKSSHRPARHDRSGHRDRDRDNHRKHDKRGRGRDYKDRAHGSDHGKRGYNRKYKHGYKDGYRDGHKYSGHGRGHRKHGYRDDYKYSGHGDYGRPHHSKYKHKYYRKHRSERYHRHYWRPSHYHYGYRWRHLPRSFVRISFGGLGLFYSDGIFYRPHDHGYVVAPAPIGAVVHSLPGSAFSVVFGGLNYYVAYDTYYLWDGPSRGYRVVANPGFY